MEISWEPIGCLAQQTNSPLLSNSMGGSSRTLPGSADWEELRVWPSEVQFSLARTDREEPFSKATDAGKRGEQNIREKDKEQPMWT